MRWLSLCKILLSPVLVSQGRRTKRTALRLPEPEGERTGLVRMESEREELRVLFVGDSTMAGVGVRHQAAALAQQTAAVLAQQLQRSVRWQLVARSGVRTGQVIELAASHTLLSPDVLVTALGGNDVLAQTRPRRFLVAYKTLLEKLLPDSDAGIAVISGLPPLHITPAVPQPLRWFFGRYALSLDRTLQRWIAPQANVAYLSLQWAADHTRLAEDRFHPGEGLYRTWAILIAMQVVDLLQGRATSCV